jgi:hypothetical protein
MKTGFPRCAGILVAALVATALVPASAFAVAKNTLIESPPGGNPPANGGSDNTTFSFDDRQVTAMAFDSSAALTPGDTDGKRDVYVLKRTGGEGNLAGTLSNVSKTLNTDSTLPSLSGEGSKKPKCVVFQSGGKIYLAGLGGNPKEIAGGSKPTVDGSCEFIVYRGGGGVRLYDLGDDESCGVGRGSNPDGQTNGKGAAYERGGSIKYQAWNPAGCEDGKLDKDGGEVTADKPKTGSAGAGVSKNPSMDDQGRYVAFESTKTGLCNGGCEGSGGAPDQNGPVSDVFRRTLGNNPPTNDHMQRASFSCGAKGAGGACEVNAYANGPSNNPECTGACEYVVYDSEATNLRESADISSIDPNGPVRDVFLWNFPRERRKGNVSRESRPGGPLRAQQFYNGPSTKPSTSARGNYLGFTGQFTTAGDPPQPTSGVDQASAQPNVFMRFAGGSDEGLVTN